MKIGPGSVCLWLQCEAVLAVQGDTGKQDSECTDGCNDDCSGKSSDDCDDDCSDD
jgi:hypothetical protein